MYKFHAKLYFREHKLQKNGIYFCSFAERIVGKCTWVCKKNCQANKSGLTIYLKQYPDNSLAAIEFSNKHLKLLFRLQLRSYFYIINTKLPILFFSFPSQLYLMR